MIFLVIILAAIIGSFLNMLVYRLPLIIMGEDISLIKPARSFCPNCKHSLSITDLVPIISYILLQAQCQHCQKKISVQYILIEIISVVSSIVLYYYIGFNVALLYFLLLNYSLIALFFIDNNHQLLPDIITLPILWLGLIYNLQFGDINASIIGTIIGYLSFWGLFWLFKLLRRKEVLGYGDFKFIAMIGAWFGWQLLPIWLFFGSIFGIIFYLIKIKDKHQHFALTPSFIIALPFALFNNVDAIF